MFNSEHPISSEIWTRHP